jgi:magnesium chelatase family protein
MALARAWAVALTGVTGHLIAVEADLAAGLPGTTVIGFGRLRSRIFQGCPGMSA